MDFISTRGQYKNIDFQQVVLEGLSRDGGLFIPASYPDLSGQLKTLKQLPYCELAFEIFRHFTGESILESELKNIIKNSYSTFQSEQVTPLKHLNETTILELFHGPTFAFKDVASAREDRERLRNEAEAYQNDIIPRTRGEAEKMLREAEAYKVERVKRSQGDADRFLEVLKEYRKAKDVTETRLFLETMEKVLPGMQKFIVDTDGKGGLLNVLQMQKPLVGGN